MKHYRADYRVSITLTVDDDVIDRVLENRDNWRSAFYNLDEHGVVEMLARRIGLDMLYLPELDGWADLPREAAQTTVEAVMELVEGPFL